MLETKPLDYVACIIAGFAIAASIFVATSRSGAPQIRIKTADAEYIYPVDTKKILALDGPIGTTIVEIADGRVRVSKDPGPRQICVKKGWIQKPGQWLACLPSQIFISIEGNRDPPSIDAVAY